jgi:hypothetical protein
MIDVRSEVEAYFRRRRISLRLRLRSLRKVCSSLIASAGTEDLGSAKRRGKYGKDFVGIGNPRFEKHRFVRLSFELGHRSGETEPI